MNLDLWPAPLADAPVDADVRLPGSKSLTNRQLVLAALANSPSRLRHPLRSRDTQLMADALVKLGTTIDDDGPDWVITPGQLRGDVDIDCGLAGTVMRFVPAVAALADGPVRFDGDETAQVRPMGPVLAGLRQLGVEILAEQDRLPYTVVGAGSVRGGTVEIDASGSSQFVSGLLLAAPRFDAGVTVRHVGPSVPSRPHIEMTLAELRAAGAHAVELGPTTWQVAAGPLAGRDIVVEPDLSNAAPFLAAALVTGGRITVPDWPSHTTQPGALLPGIFTQLGAEVSHEGSALTVRGRGVINGLDLDLSAGGELAPVLATVLVLANAPSRLRGIGHLRGHETDRLAALETELGALGADVQQTPDGLAITPRPLSGGVFHTYHDHRLATAGALLGLVIPGIEVENVATTAKTIPEFVTLWQEMLTE